MNDPFNDYRRVQEKVDAAVFQLSQRVLDQLACKKHCSDCCIDGLTILPVEADAIGLFLESKDIVPDDSSGCVFLDSDGACQIYEARPLLCRTHGVPLTQDEDRSTGALVVLQDGYSVCEKNFKERKAAADEILDTERIQALLLVVNQQYCANQNKGDPALRVPLRDLIPEGSR